MALDAEALGEAIVSRIESSEDELGELATAKNYAGYQRKLWTEIASAIVAHFQANAEVLPDGGSPMAAGGDPVTGTGRVA